MNYNVIIPEDYFIGARFEQENVIGFASINKGLCSLEPKVVFQWHLSIMLHLIRSNADGQPLASDHDEINAFEDLLYDIAEASNPAKPEGLFLAKIMWNGTVEFIWRVVDPEVYDKQLQLILTKKEYEIPFNFKINKDPEWEMSKWHLNIAC